MAETTTIPVEDVETFKRKALAWANRFAVVCLLDNNNYQVAHYPATNWTLAVDRLAESTFGPPNVDTLEDFLKEAGATIFGFFSYDLKNQLERLESIKPDAFNFPDFYFFKPRYLLELNGNRLTVNRNYPETFEILDAISNMELQQQEVPPPVFKARTAKQDYLQHVHAIKEQIAEGDFYELNYCTEFYAEQSVIKPIQVFQTLNTTAAAPFSSFFKWQHNYLLCASPERFLKKQGDKLISQPIKGTIKKGNNAEENRALMSQLQNDSKERAENVMIVDLVRNDLARSCKPGTVKVEELFGVYSFNTVNQMISTVTGTMDNPSHWLQAIKNAFPMGSMTGAPKVIVMHEIERHEDFKRGLYSGSIGYITPETDFDFNVVIRSILYNSQSNYLSVRVGGAITADSVAEKEYEEVLLKAQGMFNALGATVIP
ncbi:MAG: anthranilate synthase component I family protein [Chitinophagales bacterium]